MFRIALKQTMWLELHRRELKEELKLKLFSFVSTWKSSFMFGNFLSNQNFSIVIETLQRLFHSLILSGRRRDVTACRTVCFCNLSITKTLNLFSNSKNDLSLLLIIRGKLPRNSIIFCDFYEDTQTFWVLVAYETEGWADAFCCNMCDQ